MGKKLSLKLQFEFEQFFVCCLLFVHVQECRSNAFQFKLLGKASLNIYIYGKITAAMYKSPSAMISARSSWQEVV